MLGIFLIAQLVLSQGVPLSVAPDSKLWIEGDSSIHPWSCKANKLDIRINADLTAAQPARSLSVRIPVADLECGNDLMNSKLQNALKAEEHPAIQYKLISTERIAGEGVVLKTTGALSIAGRTRNVAFVVDAAVNADGSVYAIGSVPLLMSDYDVERPSAMFGAIKTYDPLTVKFELHAIPRPVAHASLP